MKKASLIILLLSSISAIQAQKYFGYNVKEVLKAVEKERVDLVLDSVSTKDNFLRYHGFYVRDMLVTYYFNPWGHCDQEVISVPDCMLGGMLNFCALLHTEVDDSTFKNLTTGTLYFFYSYQLPYYSSMTIMRNWDIFALQGSITDFETGKPIEGATVTLVGSDKRIIEVITDKNGFYTFEEGRKKNERYMIAETSYIINISKEGYLNSKGEETTVGLYQSTTFVHDFALQVIK